jgi:uncharacterized membrane protein
MPILVLKTLHVLAAIAAVGINVSSTFWLARAGLDRERLLFVIANARRLDRSIANPGYIVLLLTGLGMVALGAYPLTSGWILAALTLYVLVAVLGITVFAPAIRIQLAEAERDPSSPAYAVAATRSRRLGFLTTGIVAVIVVLMVTKPF